MKPNDPPRLVNNFFRWFCHPEIRDYIEGDLIELYRERLLTSGKRKADLWFAIDVILLFRPGIVRSFQYYNQNPSGMLKSYFVISWRTVSRNKIFTAINIAGLAIGLAACLLILQFVIFELSFDRFHSKLERTYRVTNDRFQNGKLIQHGTITYPTIGPVMAREFPEIEEFSRVMPVGTINVRIDDRNFRDDEAIMADERFFSLFDFDLLAGDVNGLKAPYTALLTETTARKFFDAPQGDARELIGKTFYWGLDQTPYEVKGILANVPANSHIQFDAIISYATMVSQDPEADNSWRWSDMYHYLVLKPGSSPEALQSKFEDFSQRHFQGDKVSGSIEKFYLQPLSRAHLYSDYEYDFADTASGKAVWAMLIVAIFILVIAWINYVNLTTSRAIERAKEVGLRKVMGAFKSQVVAQFIFESLVITIIAAILSVLLVLLLQPMFNQIVGAEFTWRMLWDHVTLRQLVLIITALIIGAAVAGFYPAMILSKYQPVMVLKGKFTRSASGHLLRKALVVFQFTASAALIAGTLIVTRQIQFMNEADLGFNMKNLVVVESPQLLQYDSTFNTRIEDFKEEVKKISSVINATTTWRVPGDRLGRAFNVRVDGQPADMHYTISHVGVDHDFFKTMDIKVVGGRTFLPSDHRINFDDLNTVVINKHAMRLFGFKNPDDAVGQQLLWGNDGTRKWTIVGVVNDYHQEGLQKPMEAMVFRPAYSTDSPILVKIESGTNVEEAISNVKTLYQKFFAGNSFEYDFLEDQYKAQYRDDQRFGKVIGVFTGIAIVVACLGLIGLSSFTAAQRTKEIGIRKVLGATVMNVVSILSIDFIKLVIFAALISIPIAYISMREWLDGYTYRIDLNWILFALPVIMVILIATITICFQVLKVAMTKPAETLKCE